ncbi:putative F-box/FBD/LRR-repeat protein [Carex littledalei]|uniref:Putative F-box/FBD/LRR-repeat protein n=1 Tax=Carex littledalei TaxID=544730 RepID=A0A833QF33_9POAL|nr:putative F-box/FBD/LRR-repeat protein [Carex littledalei]
MARSELENSRSRGNKDMLSSLPDPVLHHIMSFMPAWEAVQLCVLSKRWKTLWTTLLVLNFGFRELRNNQLNHSSLNREKRFTDFVSTVLFLREATSQLHTLTLDCVNYYVVPGDVLCTSIRPWIRYAIKCNLRVLTIKNIFLPSEFFTCPSLEYVTLNIAGRIDTPEVINLPSLKQLHLKITSELGQDFMTKYTLELDQDFISKLLCGCPVLEDLHVEGGMVGFFKITSHSLKHLKFMTHCHKGSSELSEMTINCPNLLSFHFKMCYCQEKGIILNMPSLYEACIEFDICTCEYDPIEMTKSNILCGLSNVHRLELGNYLDVSYLPEFNPLSSLLEHCPNLKKLSLDLSVCGDESKQIKVARFKCEQLETVEVKFYEKDRIFRWVVKCLREAVAELPNCRIIKTSAYH